MGLVLHITRPRPLLPAHKPHAPADRRHTHRLVQVRASPREGLDHKKDPRQDVFRHYEIGALFEAASLLETLPRYTAGPLRPWALRLTTALEFFATVDAAVYDTRSTAKAADALRDAIPSAQGVRALMDAFDEWLIDEPEQLSMLLQRVDAAFAQRLQELARAQRNTAQICARTAKPIAPPRGLWGMLLQQLDQNVEWRSGPLPPHDPLDRTL